jgi:hypothetical protein
MPGAAYGAAAGPPLPGHPSHSMGLAPAAAGGGGAGGAVAAAAGPMAEFNPDLIPKGVPRDMALQRVSWHSSSSNNSSNSHPLHAYDVRSLGPQAPAARYNRCSQQLQLVCTCLMSADDASTVTHTLPSAALTSRAAVFAGAPRAG